MTQNKHVLSWIDEMAAMTQPDKIVWIDGSEEQAEALRAEGTPAILDTTGMDEEALNEYAKEKGIETVMFMNGGEA